MSCVVLGCGVVDDTPILPPSPLPTLTLHARHLVDSCRLLSSADALHSLKISQPRWRSCLAVSLKTFNKASEASPDESLRTHRGF